MPKYKRVLLKLSGEVHAGEKHIGIDFGTVRDFAVKLAEIRNAGIELSLVIGGGNMIRGRDSEDYGLDRVSLDGIGMLGTVMNALAVKTASTVSMSPQKSSLRYQYHRLLSFTAVKERVNISRPEIS